MLQTAVTSARGTRFLSLGSIMITCFAGSCCQLWCAYHVPVGVFSKNPGQKVGGQNVDGQNVDGQKVDGQKVDGQNVEK